MKQRQWELKRRLEKTISNGLDELGERVVGCTRCPRLMAYAKMAAARKTARYSDWEYWAKPVPGFGDPNARLLIIGLAPATSGALRTGRIFTGDASSRFLVRALHKAGFANQPVSESVDDGLVYTDCYLTAALKCAPPGDKPTRQEVENCAEYLEGEVRLLRRLESVLVLGALAFGAYRDFLARSGRDVRGMKFSHGGVYPSEGSPTLYCSYHPSPRNTNTGKLTQGMLVRVLSKIKRDLG